MRKVFIKPARADLIVRDPDLADPVTHVPRPLRAEGEIKDLTPYWRRRLRDGDVIEASAPHNEKAIAAPKKKHQ